LLIGCDVIDIDLLRCALGGDYGKFILLKRISQSKKELKYFKKINMKWFSNYLKDQI